MTDAVIIASNAKVRIVRVDIAENTIYTIEVEDGHDALGVPRWREVSDGSKVVKAMRDLVLSMVIEQQQQERT